MFTKNFFFNNVSGTVGGGSSYLLDTYSGADVAYSVRRLSSSYSGFALRVRRSSDNTEQDIGFIGEDLDTSTLTTFCSGTDGFVTTWYDQSGNAEDLVQANTGKQPKIVSSGSIITYNGKPTLQFDGTDDYLENAVAYGSNVSLYYVTQRVGNGSGSDSYRPDIGLVYTSDKGAFHYVNPSLQGAAYPFFNTGGSYDGFGSYANGDKYLINFEWEASVGFSVYRNNALEKDVTGSVSIPSNTTGFTVSYQRLSPSQERISNNNFCEIIQWPVNQSSNRSAINSNMNSYFSVYSVYDPDAQAYIDAVLAAGGTLTSPQQDAVNTLFVDLKTNGLYSKLFSFYPMMGGVQNSISLNGFRTTTTYDIVFNGSWTFNSNGAEGNGSDTYGTFNIYGDTLPATNSHFALYGNKANNNTVGYDLSINYNNQGGRVQSIILEYQDSGNAYAEYSGYAAVSGSDTDDFIIVSRNSAGTETIRARNGVALANKTESCLDIDNTRQWFLGAEQSSNGTKAASTTNRYIWIGFGYKLTPTELLTYQNVVNTFQTSLGRNTY